MKKIGQIFGLALLQSSILYAQPWQTGGNNAGLNPVTNFFGSQSPNNTWLRMGVNGSQDIFIDNNPFQLLPASGNNPGVLQGGHWVGLGRAFGASVGPGNNPLLSPKAHLHIHGGGFTARGCKLTN